ncbi:PAS domain S-box-containing protein/diguanylate cyclase (GGDEF) domain-containing protein [Kushneria avicenniae]|uniref:PAS domain S-box-containing protein/diguanylate cyclase (GGDEF) domain-containing protein n=1 Tax=Kushneria avicenniae TaxID=402385 RepID=A0A1I1LSQ6_9GAMM|nr:MASE3 domain-containing protein [Kushneria avicenniae]SFC76111.1 PAS domain S-box-containing protein/diguanylate cyclase (GGDEF) domain-containing protein [Kushneria avicenniae]
MATLKLALRHLLIGPSGRLFWALLAFMLLLTLLPKQQVFSQLHSYLGFHSLIELTCVIVAILATLSIFNSYRTLSTQYLCVGALLALSAMLDSLHLLSMPGMPDLFTPNTLNKAIYFWLLARLCAISALLLLSLSHLPDQPARFPRLILVAFLCAGVLALIGGFGYLDRAPDLYIPGQGLTPLKISLEWGLAGMSVLAGLILLRSSHLQRRRDREMLTVAAWVTALAEICFTLYGTANDEFNVLGHLYKAVSYILIFRALFLSHLRYPWKALNDTRTRLAEQEQRWNLALTGSDTGVWDMNLVADEIFASAQFHQILGYRNGALPRDAQAWRDRLLHPEDIDRVVGSFDDHVAGHSNHWRCEYRFLDAQNRWRWLLANGQIMDFDEDQCPTRIVGTVIDIQAQREQEQHLADTRRRLQTLFDTTPTGMLVIDSRGVIHQHNPMLSQLLTPHEIAIGQDFIWQWASDEDGPDARQHWDQWQQQDATQRREPTWHRELRMSLHGHGRAGQPLWAEWVIAPLPEEGLYLLLIEDISARKRATELLIENAGLYRSTFESGNAIKLLLDPDNSMIVDANTAACDYYGYPLETLKTMTMAAISLTAQATRQQRIHQTLEQREGYFETRHRLANGTIRDVEIFTASVVIGGRTLIYEMVHDTTIRKEAEQGMVTLNQRLSRDGLHRERLNRLSTQLFELSAIADVVPLLDQHLAQCFPDTSGELALRIEELDQAHCIRWGEKLSTQPAFEYRQRLTTTTGALGRMTLQAEPLDDEDRHRLERMVDETARILTLTLINLRLRNQLTNHAYRDALTGLYNRRYLNETLPDLLENASEESPVSLALLDLDHFKRLNDTWGHDAGDQVLIALGEILTQRLRATDISCRYGGEEFIVVLPGASASIAMMRLNEVLEQFGQWSMQVGDERIAHLTFSAGLVNSPSQGHDMSALIELADQALYGAKHAGRGRVQLATHEMRLA